MIAASSTPEVKALEATDLVWLELSYETQFLLQPNAGNEIGDLLRAQYIRTLEEKKPQRTDCVLQLKAKTAGSSMVRALFVLYTEVQAKSGRLVVLGYPKNNMLSLTTLGLDRLPGFLLAPTVDSARTKLQQEP